MACQNESPLDSYSRGTFGCHPQSYCVGFAGIRQTYGRSPYPKITTDRRFPIVRPYVPEYEIDQIREVIEGPYRIIYHIKPDQIDVVAVIHGAMNLLHS
jgi:hypothetical protein